MTAGLTVNTNKGKHMDTSYDGHYDARGKGEAPVRQAFTQPNNIECFDGNYE